MKIEVSMVNTKTVTQLWDSLRTKYSLSQEQLDQLQRYAVELQEWNEKFNLTALTSMEDIITYHFDDSLILSEYTDLNAIQCIADVGTGAGFPIIPLKIMYPHLKPILIEPSSKRITFLEHIISLLSLKDVTIYSKDWKMFVRKTDYPVDMVVARASLRPEELGFMFKPSSLYKNATLVYWASDQWVAGGNMGMLLSRQVAFDIGAKKRQLIFFKQ